MERVYAGLARRGWRAERRAAIIGTCRPGAPPGPEDPPVLVLSRAAASVVRAHAEAVAPREACGLLLGTGAGEALRVERARPARNASGAPDAFVLPAEDLLEADAEARALGLEILGAYHSHPGGSERPSAQDCREADPAWIVLVVAVRGRAPAARATAEAAWRIAGPPHRPRAVRVALAVDGLAPGRSSGHD